MTTEPTRTVLHASFPDQPALAGMLAKIRLLGLELLELRRLPSGPGHGHLRAAAGGSAHAGHLNHARGSCFRGEVSSPRPAG
jgi:hypothetical protein